MSIKGKTIRNRVIAVTLLSVIVSLVFPMLALAAEGTGNSLNFASVVESLKDLTSLVFLPLGILIASWRIVYLSALCGIAGIDPLDMLPEGTDPKTSAVWTEVKNHFKGFAYGLAWVAGIWILFQLVLTIVGVFVGSFANVF